MTKQKTTVRFERGIWEAAKACAGFQGKTFEEFCNQALKSEVKKHQATIPNRLAAMVKNI